MKWIPPVDPGNRFKLKLMKRNKNDYAILEGNSFEENDAFSRLKVVNYKQIADIRRAELQKLLQFVQECIENDELTHKPFVEAVNSFFCLMANTVTCRQWIRLSGR